MTKHIRSFKILSLTLILVLPLLSKAAGGDEPRKKKTINKTYNVSASDKLDIENSFGDVVVNTWDKNEIAVDIEIGANASTDEKAQAILDGINVTDKNEGHVISFKTNIRGDREDRGNRMERRHGDNNGEENKRSFYINYTVHMPAGNPLTLSNSFGKTTVPDMSGEVDLTSKFGQLEAGKLSNVDVVDVEFGKAKIGSVNGGKLVFKFDGPAEVGKISGDVKLTSEFSHRVQFNIADDIKQLGIYESYSTIRMVVSKQLSADFDVHTSFGGFRNRSDFSITEAKEDHDEYGPHFDKDFSGKAGDGKGKIKIKSSFGSVSLSHEWNNNDDEKDKDKDKVKDKVKNRHKHEVDI